MLSSLPRRLREKPGEVIRCSKVHYERGKAWLMREEDDKDLDKLVLFLETALPLIAIDSSAFSSLKFQQLVLADYDNYDYPFRGSVLCVHGGNVLVEFIDFGNVSWISSKNVYCMPEAAQKFPPLCFCCVIPLSKDVESCQIKLKQFDDHLSAWLADTDNQQAPSPCSSNGITLPSRHDHPDMTIEGRILNVDLDSKLLFVCPNDCSATLSELQNILQSIEKNRYVQGDFCVALYEGEAFRARILQRTSNNLFQIEYIDYGNIDEVGDIYEMPKVGYKYPPLSVRCLISDDIDIDSLAIDDDSPPLRLVSLGANNVWNVSIIKRAPSLSTNVSAVVQSNINVVKSANVPSRLEKPGDVITGQVVYKDDSQKLICLSLPNESETLESLLSHLAETKLHQPILKPVLGQYCIACYLDVPYRARVLEISGSDYLVEFIDYGNVDRVQQIWALTNEAAVFPPFCIKSNIIQEISSLDVEMDTPPLVLRSKKSDVWDVELSSGSHIPMPTLPERNDAPGHLVTGKICHMDPEFGVLCITPTNEEDILSNVQEALNSSPLGEITFNDFHIGLICAAEYDGTIYRAKVLSVDPNNQTADVEFIDYGNVERGITNLLQLPEPAFSYPPFCIKCSVTVGIVDPSTLQIDDPLPVPLVLTNFEEGLWNSTWSS